MEEANVDIGELDELLKHVDMVEEPEPVEWDNELPDEVIWSFLSEIEGKVDASIAASASVTIEPPPTPAPDKKSPFVKLSDAELRKIEGKDEKTTKSATSWGVNRLKSWLKAREMSEDFENLAAQDLADVLRKFYAEVRKLDGKEYSKNALCGLRSAIHRRITSAPFNRPINIMRGQEFKAANNMLIGVLKSLKREGKDFTRSYTPISEGDIGRLMASGVFGMDTPDKLLKLVWFSTQFYFCRRGGEGLSNLRTDSFEFKVDSTGREFVQMTYNEASKNHPGGFKNTNDPSKKMYATGGTLCPVMALKKYLQKVNPVSTALYQRPINPLVKVEILDDGYWYTGEQLGINKLRGMMATLSNEAKLSVRYTNHCIRATVITNLINCGFDPVTISRLSGHRNPASVLSYCNDTSENVKRNMADALNSTLVRNPSQAIEPPSRQQQPPSRQQQRHPFLQIQAPQHQGRLPVPVIQPQSRQQQQHLSVSAVTIPQHLARDLAQQQESLFSNMSNCSLSIGTINIQK